MKTGTQSVASHDATLLGLSNWNSVQNANPVNQKMIADLSQPETYSKSSVWWTVLRQSV
jgi:hypothetical protein